MSIMKGAAILAAFVSTVAAHGIISGIEIDGKAVTPYDPNFQYRPADQRPKVAGWTASIGDHGFVDPPSYGAGDIICHKQATPGAAHANAMPGSTIKWQWTIWPDSHHGPVITYMANCNGPCETVDKSTLEFFKIDEKGLNHGGATAGQAGDWASDDLIRAGNSWVSTIPSDIAPGNYVVRHEIIALHSAYDLNGAQNYPSCINIAVGGSGSAKPAGVKGTSLYKATDPGIHIGIYNNLQSYVIPGPPLYKPGKIGKSGAVATMASSAPAAASDAPAATSDAPAATSDAPAATSDAPAATSDAGAAAPPTTDAPAPAMSTAMPSYGATVDQSTTVTTTYTVYVTVTASPTDASAPTPADAPASDSAPTDTPTYAPGTDAPAPAPTADAPAPTGDAPAPTEDAPAPTTAAAGPTPTEKGSPKSSPPPGTTLGDLIRWLLEALKKIAASPAGSTPVRRHARHYRL